MAHSHSSIAFAILAFLVMKSCAVPQSRIINGNKIDTLRRFPFYVTISSPENHFCGGSIISSQWILTASNCVSNADQFTVYFLKRFTYATSDTFSITLGASSVTRYPTGYDNIALVKLPVALQFSEDLAPISYKYDADMPEGNNGFAVLPGLPSDPADDVLQYAMLKLVPSEQCERYFGKEFDSYLELCTMSWGNDQAPCLGNEGSGLISGWPQTPRLIGIFVSPDHCGGNTPASYVKISAYQPWIDSIIGKI